MENFPYQNDNQSLSIKELDSTFTDCQNALNGGKVEEKEDGIAQALNERETIANASTENDSEANEEQTEILEPKKTDKSESKSSNLEDFSKDSKNFLEKRKYLKQNKNFEDLMEYYYSDQTEYFEIYKEKDFYERYIQELETKSNQSKKVQNQEKHENLLASSKNNLNQIESPNKNNIQINGQNTHSNLENNMKENDAQIHASNNLFNQDPEKSIFRLIDKVVINNYKIFYVYKDQNNKYELVEYILIEKYQKEELKNIHYVFPNRKSAYTFISYIKNKKIAGYINKF